ncbi:MAG: ATP-binding cassette domain-containing protein [FCB group bacterium]|nr:ATP-binding cassette domain-containing protein [FCB group bacterium]
MKDRQISMERQNSPAVSTQELARHFGKRIAVSGLNLEIQKGEIFSLLGTNGAGKTTTIKMLCCLLQPTAGTASLMGYDIRKDPAKIKDIIGVSPQETAITGHLNTKENLLLMGGVSGLSKKESRERAEELMHFMGLEDRKDQTRKLSGGMQRRLSIAMALMSDPKILFLDEPTLGLDPHARRQVWSYIEKLREEKTILLTTHYLEEADALSDHLAIIHEGSIIARGTSRELKKSFSKMQNLKINTEYVPPQLVDILKKNNIEHVTYNKGVLEISAMELDLYALMDILRSQEVKINGIYLQEASLDDIFIKLTGEGVSS